MNAQPITGGCQCGAVRYAIAGPLGRASICHCRMWQKAFGAFFGPLVVAPGASFQLTRGSLAIFRSSDAAERGFCCDCGTPLTFRYLDSDGIDVAIGSLDQLEAAKPVAQFRTESRPPWLDELAGLPTRESAGAEERLAAVERTSRQRPDHDTTEWPAPSNSAGAGEAR